MAHAPADRGLRRRLRGRTPAPRPASERGRAARRHPARRARPGAARPAGPVAGGFGAPVADPPEPSYPGAVERQPAGVARDHRGLAAQRVGAVRAAAPPSRTPPAHGHPPGRRQPVDAELVERLPPPHARLRSHAPRRDLRLLDVADPADTRAHAPLGRGRRGARERPGRRPVRRHPPRRLPRRAARVAPRQLRPRRGARDRLRRLGQRSAGAARLRDGEGRPPRPPDRLAQPPGRGGGVRASRGLDGRRPALLRRVPPRRPVAGPARGLRRDRGERDASGRVRDARGTRGWRTRPRPAQGR